MVNQPEWIREAIVCGNQFHYRKSNPYLHNALNLSVLTFILAGLVGVALAAAVVPFAIYIPLAAYAFGLLYFTLITLVDHEACHGMFVVSSNRNRALYWNRFFGWSVCVFFAMHFQEDWEKGHHQEHHLRPIENEGAIYQHLALGKELVTRCAKLLFIPGYLFVFDRQFSYEGRTQARATRGYLLPTTLLIWIVIAILTTLTISWTVPVAAYWGVQVAAAIQQVKLSLEHGGKIGTDENRCFRSRTSLFPFRWCVLPLNITLHFEHHLNYCVPWYKLPRYQRALREIVPPELQPVLFNEEVWEQLAGRKDIRVSGYDSFTRSSPTALAAISHPVVSE